MAKPIHLPLLAATAMLAGCASRGEFPSLAPRAAEYELAGRPVPPCLPGARSATAEPVPAPVARDPQLAGEVETLLGAARRGQIEFAAVLPEAEASSRRAGAPGSEAWIAAQQDLSRLEAARARIVDALTRLDALLIARSGTATNAEDLQLLTQAVEEVRALALRQQSDLERLSGSLG